MLFIIFSVFQFSERCTRCFECSKTIQIRNERDLLEHYLYSIDSDIPEFTTQMPFPIIVNDFSIN